MSFVLDALNGERKLKFTVGVDVGELLNSDFYVEQTFEIQDDGSKRQIYTVRSAWWGDPAVSNFEGTAKLRTTEENFLLFETLKGGTGVLIIDEGDPKEINVPDATLVEINPSWNGTKGFFEWDFIFKGPELAGADGELSFPRDIKVEVISPLTTVIESIGFPFIDTPQKDSETLFKLMYRTNPFRVEQGLPTTLHTFTNVRFTATLTETTPAGKVAEMETAHSVMQADIGKKVKITLDAGETYERIIAEADLQQITIQSLTPSRMLLNIVALEGFFE